MTEFITPKQIRQQSRTGAFTGQTSGMCPGYTQANLVILPKKRSIRLFVICTTKSQTLSDFGSCGCGI